MTTEKIGRPVVVGVDGSDSADAAVRWAARYAGETGSPLHLLFAVGHQMALIGISTAEIARAERVRERVLASAAPHDADTVIVRGSAAPALTEAATEADLLVLGESHRRSGLAVQVVAEAECPVVVVRGDEDWAGPVVVGVEDGSEAAMGFAVREAARRDVPLFAVHAWQQPLVPTGAVALAATGVVDREDWADAARRSLTAAVKPWRDAFPEVTIHERLVEGPADTVVTHETGGAGLVVTGSRGRGRLAGALLGSTSQALLRHSDCPVAIVRS